MTTPNNTISPETAPPGRVRLDAIPSFPLGLVWRDAEVVATVAFGFSDVVGWWRRRSRLSDRRRCEVLTALVRPLTNASPRLLGQAPDRGEPDQRVDGPAAAEPEILVEG